MNVSGIFLYPVKSLRGFAVQQAEVDELGFVGDRQFLVIDEADRFLTQRTLPQMAHIATGYERGFLTLSADGRGRIEVATQPGDRPAIVRSVTIWKSEGLLAEDCGDLAAGWLSDALNFRCRLVRIGREFVRPVTKPAARPGDRTAFTDAFPFMAVSDASVVDLNDRLVERGEEPVPMNRFRPSFTISGSAPYAEDTWPRVRVGDVVLRAGGPCARCIVTTTNQETGDRGKEPLNLLSTYRRDRHDSTRINFGQNFIHETKRGILRVGDSVEPLPAERA